MKKIILPLIFITSTLFSSEQKVNHEQRIKTYLLMIKASVLIDMNQKDKIEDISIIYEPRILIDTIKSNFTQGQKQEFKCRFTNEIAPSGDSNCLKFKDSAETKRYKDLFNSLVKNN